MISVDIPGLRTLELAHLVLDFNGTLAVDGKLLDGIAPRMAALANELDLHVVTGNTYGNAREQLRECAAEIVCLSATDQAQAKLDYVRSLGPEHVVAAGNGRNDVLMLEQATLAIAVLGSEGLSTEALEVADVVVRHAVDALGLLLRPKRLVATLRS